MSGKRRGFSTTVLNLVMNGIEAMSDVDHCRSILQNHGGRLWASAHDGPGGTFQFSLPKHDEKE